MLKISAEEVDHNDGAGRPRPVLERDRPPRVEGGARVEASQLLGAAAQLVLLGVSGALGGMRSRVSRAPHPPLSGRVGVFR